jgi:hypothetical protein
MTIDKRFFTAVMAVALAACGGAADGGAVGEVRVSLVGTGTDGAEYRLPPGTYLHLFNSRFNDSHALTSASEIEVVRVPVGNYTWALGHSTAYMPEAWELERDDGLGNVESVLAVLENEQPLTLVVAGGGPSELVLQFRAARGGKIVFQQNDLNVSLDVTSVSTLGGRMVSDTPVLEVTEVLADEAPAELVSRLPSLGQTGFGVTVEGQILDAWEQTSFSEVCTDVADFAMSTTSSGASGFADVFHEAFSTTARLCVSGTAIYIQLRRDGEARTTTFSDLGATDLHFSHRIYAQLGVTVFDGESLDLEALAGLRGGLSAHVYLNVTDASSGWTPWYYAELRSESASFRFVPAE